MPRPPVMEIGRRRDGFDGMRLNGAGALCDVRHTAAGLAGSRVQMSGAIFWNRSAAWSQEGSVALLFQESGQVAGEGAGIGEDQPEAGFGLRG